MSGSSRCVCGHSQSLHSYEAMAHGNHGPCVVRNCSCQRFVAAVAEDFPGEGPSVFGLPGRASIAQSAVPDLHVCYRDELPADANYRLATEEEAAAAGLHNFDTSRGAPVVPTLRLSAEAETVEVQLPMFDLPPSIEQAIEQELVALAKTRPQLDAVRKAIRRVAVAAINANLENPNAPRLYTLSELLQVHSLSTDDMNLGEPGKSIAVSTLRFLQELLTARPDLAGRHL